MQRLDRDSCFRFKAELVTQAATRKNRPFVLGEKERERGKRRASAVFLGRNRHKNDAPFNLWNIFLAHPR